ncbi:MAG: hypothetical protein JXA57_05660 [Armatimonadetes bacterium]|nr:hypothetical protein [Armatimonadota bacterium]
MTSLLGADPLLGEATPFTADEIEKHKPPRELALSDFTWTLSSYLKLFLNPEYVYDGSLTQKVVPLLYEQGDDYLYYEYSVEDFCLRIRDSKYVAIFIEPRDAVELKWRRHPGAPERLLEALLRRFVRPDVGLALYEESLLSSRLGAVRKYTGSIATDHNPCSVYTDGFFVLFIILKTPKWPNQVLGISPEEWEGRHESIGPGEIFAETRKCTRKIVDSEGREVRDMFASPHWYPARGPKTLKQRTGSDIDTGPVTSP